MHLIWWTWIWVKDQILLQYPPVDCQQCQDVLQRVCWLRAGSVLCWCYAQDFLWYRILLWHPDNWRPSVLRVSLLHLKRFGLGVFAGLSSLFPHAATSLWPIGLDLQPRSSAAGEIIEVSAGFLGLGVHWSAKVVKFGDVLWSSCPGDTKEHDYMGLGLQRNRKWMDPDVPESRRSLYANILHIDAYYAYTMQWSCTFTCFEPDLKLQSHRVNDWCRLSPAVPFDEWYADQGGNATSQHQQHDNSSRCIPFLGLFRKRQWRDGITPFCAHPWHVCLELTKSIEVPWNTAIHIHSSHIHIFNRWNPNFWNVLGESGLAQPIVIKLYW